MLDEKFWNERYLNANTGWDLGEISPPIKEYFDSFTNTSAKILIPGCGNAYEAEYLFKKGFTNVHVIDLAQEPLKNLKKRLPDFPDGHIHHGDFFALDEERFDVIVEQTLFCAISPLMRQQYANKIKQLLKPNGVLIGVLFGVDFSDLYEDVNDGPPFGGSKKEYHTYFDPLFDDVKIEECYNSVKPRAGSELFIRIRNNR